MCCVVIGTNASMMRASRDPCRAIMDALLINCVRVGTHAEQLCRVVLGLAGMVLASGIQSLAITDCNTSGVTAEG